MIKPLLKHPTKQQRASLKLALMTLLGGVCTDCGLMPHQAAMDFDHRDPKQKRYEMTALIGRAARDMPGYKGLLLEEVFKCDLRCANCHRIKTYVNNDTATRRLQKK